ncbi:MAG: hypothetical protein E7604_04000 [Ruminococcaceae bacterium]|nr:hypothetical protein [Oscillospiraceae bacterium]
MTFFEARAYFGIDGIPDCLEPYYAEDPPLPILDRAWLSEQCEACGVSGENTARLTSALDALQSDPALLSFTNFLIRQQCQRHLRLDASYIDLGPCKIMTRETRDFYPMLVMLGCIRPATEGYLARGIDESVFAQTVERMLSSVLRRYGKTGDPHVSFEWQSGFFSCALLQFSRFYFAPHRYDDGITILKNRITGEVIALLPDEDDVYIRHSDGQYNGIAGIREPDAFHAVRADTDDAFIGHPIDPIGCGSEQIVMLPKSEWEVCVHEGDAFLALHIPGGEGYDPEHLRQSAQDAIAFYDRFIPEYRIRGIWSESWLYDPHLRKILPPNSKIIRMQDQMYCMPFAWGEPTIHGELIEHDPPTSLERTVADYEAAGGTFSTNFMFILREDVGRIGADERVYPQLML